MDLIETLYAQSDPKHNLKAWNMFPLLSPQFSFLRTKTTRAALAAADKSYPLDAVRFVLFPGEQEAEANKTIRECMNRGGAAINSLTEQYLGEQLNDSLRELLILPTFLEQFDLGDLVRQAREEWERGTMRVRRINPEPREKAYRLIRALELGYRVGTIDASPDVQNSIVHVDQVIGRLNELLGFRNPKPVTKEYPNGPSLKFDTHAQVAVYSATEAPMKTRLKYVANGARQYSSLLMKIYRDLEYPNEIRDYIGSEIIVEDDAAREQIVEYIRRKTRLGGAFEGFKDSTSGSTVNAISSGKFRVKKFFLRVPVRLGLAIEPDEIGGLRYCAIPIEIQILTVDGAKQRDIAPEASHVEYKRKQFMNLFPLLFPRQIYEPEMRRRGM